MPVVRAVLFHSEKGAAGQPPLFCFPVAELWANASEFSVGVYKPRVDGGQRLPLLPEVVQVAQYAVIQRVGQCLCQFTLIGGRARLVPGDLVGDKDDFVQS